MAFTLRPRLDAQPGDVFTEERTATRLSHQAASQMRNLKMRVTVTRVDAGWLVNGTVSATAKLECSRCLEPFSLDLTVPFSELIAESGTAAADYTVTTDGTIPLDAVIATALTFGLPPQPLHDPQCRGLCPVCGRNRNREPHSHRTTKPPSPFAQLRSRWR